MASEDIEMTIKGKQQLIPQKEKFYNITKLFLIVPRSRRSLGPLPFYLPNEERSGLSNLESRPKYSAGGNNASSQIKLS